MIRAAPARGLSEVIRFGLAASLLALLPPGDVAAQQGAARQACGGDIARVCAAIQAGEGRITACVREHFTELSAACRNALISGATITKACKADYQRKCAGIEPGGGRSQACMTDHFAELDERCQQALLLGKLQRQ
jgi:cysteine rich repeat protein